MREGESETVTGDYPREIAPLAEEVNELLRSNAQIIERARNQVGNLAHGLKTPLAVLRNEAAADKGEPLAEVVLSETEKMTQLVTTYLDRARLAARTSVVGKKADATLVMLRLARVMEKLNPDVTIALQRPTPRCPGSAATRAISRKWRAICSTMPANGRRARSACDWSPNAARPAPCC